MISSWQIYWVMQFDAIGNTAEWFAWTFLISGTVLLLVGALHVMQNDEPYPPRILKWAKRAAIGCVACAVSTAFLPSSKTAAAMIVIPAIANNQKFQAEASELYDLAKSGLKKLVTEESKKDDP